MTDLATVLDVLHRAVVLLFVGVTLLLMLVSVANRLRFKTVYFAWGTGRLGGVPFLPTLFLCLVVPLLAFEVLHLSGRTIVHPLLLTGYLAGGVFWYVSALMSQTLIVAPFGILRNLNRSSQAVTWTQIEDYFFDDAGAKFVFLYTDVAGTRRRLEFRVPRAVRERFIQLVKEKLDQRFAVVMRRAYGKTALNG